MQTEIMAGITLQGGMIVKRAVISLVMLLTAGMVWVSAIAARMHEDVVQARIVETGRADVFQTIGLSGQLGYADERYVLAAETGRIERLCVTEGQRVASGEMMVQYESADKERMASTVVAAMLYETGYKGTVPTAELGIMESSIQRAEADCTVRQVLVNADTQVLAGTPLFMVSAAAQEIRCAAATADAKKIVPGMWAWICSNDERIGIAYVHSVEKIKGNSALGQNICMVSLHPEQHIDLEEGETVEAELYIAGGCDVVSLPLEAITEQDTVWWVDDEGRCTEIPAEIVVCDEKRAWVSLPEGIRVAIGEFQEGQKVVEAAE